MPTTLEIYEHLKPKLGERETRELLEWIESEKLHLATKEDIQRLEIATKENIQRLEKTMASKEELQIAIQSAKVELIKWMFASWLTLALAILGLYYKK